MSYILDALKKSEAQRNDINLPIDVPSSTTQPLTGSSRLKLPFILLTIILTTGGLLAYFQSTPQQQTPSTNTPSIASINHEAPIRIQPHDHITRNRTEPIMAAAEAKKLPAAAKNMTTHLAPSTRNKLDIVPIFKPITPVSPVRKTVSQQQFSLSEETAQASPAEANITLFSELPLSVQQSLPPIHIDGHIYDDHPAARMAIINGSLRKEKQRITPDLILEEITPHGVILNFKGHVFHMGVFGQ